MCGIAGIISLNNMTHAGPIIDMLSTLKHRGPDDEGYIGVNTELNSICEFHSEKSSIKKGENISSLREPVNVFFGHKRLSIIDLSAAGHQPMSYRNGAIWIIFNGEIYNYKELRDTLKKNGYQFGTNSDTEVILAAYQEWGVNCVKHFNGDWAFALYDKNRQIVFLSRDRYGIKPLYYHYNPVLKIFAFGSEVKSLLKAPYVSTDINVGKIFEFLVFDLMEHSCETMYKDVHQLGPGFNLIFNLKTFAFQCDQYYELAYNASAGSYNHRQALKYADDIRDLLVDSVRIRLRADVPIGTCLSGGLDSSSIVVTINKILKEEGIASDQIGSRQKTFTASFPNDTVDETFFAKSINKHTDAKGHFVFPSIDAMKREIKQIIWHQDEPFGGPSVYAQWTVMKKASDYVRVILDGQGGDEVFGGYAVYRDAYLSQLARDFKIKSLFAEAVGAIRMRKSLWKMLRELKSLPIFLAPRPLKSILYIAWKKKLIKSTLNLLKVDSCALPFEFLFSFAPNLNEVLYTYQMKYSLPHLLHYEDRNSMAFSIESRTPFTDYRLVDYVFAVPASYKYHKGWSKWLLRLAMRGLLPDEILWRKDKIGFAASESMNKYNKSKLFEEWLQSIREGMF